MSNSEGESEKVEADEAILVQLLEDDKSCAICQEVIVNACRVSCGHSFCRQCIDAQLDEKNLEGRNQRCLICDAKIDEIQNYPELDKEINALYSRMSTEKQLDRAGVKAGKKREKDEKNAPTLTRIDHSPNQDNPELPHSTVPEDPSAFNLTQEYGLDYQNNHVLTGSEYSNMIPGNYTEEERAIYLYPSDHQNNSSEFQNEGLNGGVDVDSSDSDITPPAVLMHETFTFHRTRILNPMDNDSDRNEALDQQTFYIPPPQLSIPYGYNVPLQGCYPPQQYNNCPHYYQHPCTLQQQSCPNRYHSPVPQYQGSGYNSFVPGPIFTDYRNNLSNNHGAYEYYELLVDDESSETNLDFTLHDQNPYQSPNWNESYIHRRHEGCVGRYGLQDLNCNAELAGNSPEQQLDIQIDANQMPPELEETGSEGTAEESETDSTSTYPEFNTSQDPERFYPHYHEYPTEIVGTLQMPITDSQTDL